MTASVKCASLSLLLLCVLLYIVDSYPNTGRSRIGCEECTLRKNTMFSGELPVYQCTGCCFSRAYPTPLMSKEAMMRPKNITSEATCCVATHSHETEVIIQGKPERLKNQTACHCSACHYHKQ